MEWIAIGAVSIYCFTENSRRIPRTLTSRQFTTKWKYEKAEIL